MKSFINWSLQNVVDEFGSIKQESDILSNWLNVDISIINDQDKIF